MSNSETEISAYRNEGENEEISLVLARFGIQQHIGCRPIAAFGNPDGDLQMLQWTTAGTGLRFGLIVHHTDAEREYAYDRTSSVGRPDKALDESTQSGWTVVDMKKDWKVIFPKK